MNILIIGPSWVGDMVMSQSLYKELKALNPEASIDVLAPAWCKPILQRMPEVANAIEMPVGHGSFNLSERWKIGRSLAEKKYDQAYVLPNSAKSALIPLFAGIKKRTGWKGEFRYGLLTDLRPDKRVFQYMVERYVALAYPRQDMLQKVALTTVSKPSLEVDIASQQQLKKRLNLSSERPVLGLCPGAEFGPAKRWPEEYYTSVAEHAIQSGQQVWLFGSVNDQETTDKIKSGLSEKSRAVCFDLAGKTKLVEAVDLLACCHTVISNDSGLMHVSAAVGCNIIALYGSTSPEYTPPLSDKVQILNTDIECRPCFKRECPLGHSKCLKELSPQTVIEHLEKKL
ncbi:lipopolysaccharide heptosyltransferase II [Vibrio sp. JC009]|uniref:lipopolysaccharide heptosyltransferase II n=1 Tax=Vibrio sp. JC009 TaxID=2912314 RepID=UPI0023AFFE67|nr:lipopolysaccharide heptosyltransferase II [Vibrio sp. JC009]WED21986.1 lipopolysaccharide heptosyltransferase II [Vibrio sp. JC009]